MTTNGRTYGITALLCALVFVLAAAPAFGKIKETNITTQTGFGLATGSLTSTLAVQYQSTVQGFINTTGHAPTQFTVAIFLAPGDIQGVPTPIPGMSDSYYAGYQPKVYFVLGNTIFASSSGDATALQWVGGFQPVVASGSFQGITCPVITGTVTIAADEAVDVFSNSTNLTVMLENYVSPNKLGLPIGWVTGSYTMENYIEVSVSDGTTSTGPYPVTIYAASGPVTSLP